jgi:phosphonate transport system permease protein
MNNTEKILNKKPKKWVINVIFFSVLVLLLILSFQGSTINFLRLSTFKYSLRAMANGFRDINPEFLFGYGDYQFVEGVTYMAVQTLAIAFIGTFIGAILALPISFLASERIVGKKASKIGITIITIIRVFPEVILALIILKAIGINPLTCVITIGIHSIGMLGKMFSESIDNMDIGPIEALDAVGANTYQKIRYGIIPQVIPEITSTTLYRFDINIRSASVLGVIGTLAGGFGALLLLAGSDPNNQWDTIATLLVVIVILVLFVDAVSSYLRKKLV